MNAPCIHLCKLHTLQHKTQLSTVQLKRQQSPSRTYIRPVQRKKEHGRSQSWVANEKKMRSERLQIAQMIFAVYKLRVQQSQLAHHGPMKKCQHKNFSFMFFSRHILHNLDVRAWHSFILVRLLRLQELQSKKKIFILMVCI